MSHQNRGRFTRPNLNVTTSMSSSCYDWYSDDEGELGLDHQDNPRSHVTSIEPTWQPRTTSTLENTVAHGGRVDTPTEHLSDSFLHVGTTPNHQDGSTSGRDRGSHFKPVPEKRHRYEGTRSNLGSEQQHGEIGPRQSQPGNCLNNPPENQTPIPRTRRQNIPLFNKNKNQLNGVSPENSQNAKINACSKNRLSTPRQQNKSHLKNSLRIFNSPRLQNKSCLENTLQKSSKLRNKHKTKIKPYPDITSRKKVNRYSQSLREVINYIETTPIKESHVTPMTPVTTPPTPLWPSPESEFTSGKCSEGEYRYFRSPSMPEPLDEHSCSSQSKPKQKNHGPSRRCIQPAHEERYCSPDHYVLTTLGRRHLREFTDDTYVNSPEKRDARQDEFSPLVKASSRRHSFSGPPPQHVGERCSGAVEQEDEYVQPSFTPISNRRQGKLPAIPFAIDGVTGYNNTPIRNMPSPRGESIHGNIGTVERESDAHAYITPNNSNCRSRHKSQPIYLNAELVGDSEKSDRQNQHSRQPPSTQPARHIDVNSNINCPAKLDPTRKVGLTSYEKSPSYSSPSESSCYNSPITPIYQEVDEVHMPTMSLMHTVYPPGSSVDPYPRESQTTSSEFIYCNSEIKRPRWVKSGQVYMDRPPVLARERHVSGTTDTDHSTDRAPSRATPLRKRSMSGPEGCQIGRSVPKPLPYPGEFIGSQEAEETNTPTSTRPHGMRTAMPRFNDIARTPCPAQPSPRPIATWVPALAYPELPVNCETPCRGATPLKNTRSKKRRRAILSSLKAFDSEPLTTLAIL